MERVTRHRLTTIHGGRQEPLGAGSPGEAPLRRPACRMMSIISGKGGVGKTNIAASLSIALARRGMKVLLVDADLSLSSLDLLMGVMPRHTVADVIRGTCAIEDVVVESYGGVRILPAGSGDDDLANLDDYRRERLFRSLSRIDADLDLILVDAGAGIGRNVTSLARMTGENLVVSTPEPPAMSGAYALLKVLDQAGLATPPNLLVNRASGSLEGRDTWTRIVKTCNQFLDLAPGYWGYLPEDPSVGRAVRSQEPFLLADPTSPAARGLQRLAQRVLDHPTGHEPDGAGRPVPEKERMAG